MLNVSFIMYNSIKCNEIKSEPSTSKRNPNTSNVSRDSIGILKVHVLNFKIIQLAITTG